MKKTYILLSFLLISSLSHAQIELMNDEFDNPATFSNWLQVNDTEGWNASQLEQAQITGGALLMQPWSTAWYANRRAPLLYKMVTGDFIFTTQVVVTDRDLADSDHLPASDYSLAGPMIRIPKNFTNGLTGWSAGPNENYVFLSCGYAATNHNSCPGCQGPHFEVKNTTNGNSILRISSLGISATTPITVTIRLVRTGQVILVLYQLPGDPFIVHRRYFRGNFPATMQLGFVTYTNWEKVITYSIPEHNQYTLNADLDPNLSSNTNIPFEPDLTARFQYARFNEVVVPPELSGVNLYTTATDAQLLSFLGFQSSAFLPIILKSFDVKAEGENIELKWVTTSESDNKGFEIQRSRDGLHFEKIHFAKGNGDSEEENTYFFIDNDINEGLRWYYRLKQIDWDGKSTLSPIQSAILQPSDNGVIVYPNPVLGTSIVNITSTFKQSATIKIFSVHGQLVFHQDVRLDKGANKTLLNTQKWPSAIYTLVVETNTDKNVLRFAKL